LNIADLKKEFIAELVDDFHNSLGRCLSLVLKGVRTPFTSLKLIPPAIENIRNVGRAVHVESLERVVEDFKKDIGEWRHLSQYDLAPLIKEELDRLCAQMQQTYIEETSKVEAVSMN